ncbi:Glycosyl transferases group 1 [Malonomonas rubra DSM 5091]|uniref:Glycosyl transferases group 1 n=1 Tax=Malonomonas rubra DSM 5091 TaxID=1122189 RepID=A0A1M6IBC4_MALRU|nr:GPMC system family 4 glycosyltransferase [Malonomonas rubra]SHJ31744.1 Glycosyl transferases group 1 [Malonomonas rubra DSM 5091]
MQLLIVVPKQPVITGNHITARRFADLLPQYGWQATVVEADVENTAAIPLALEQHRPDVVLLIHAYRSGRCWLQLDPPPTVPFAVFLSGTDYNHDLRVPDRAVVVDRVLQQAGAVLLQNQLALLRLGQELKTDRSKLKYLPPGIRLGNEPYPLREKLGLLVSTPLFLYPAGIRPVKGNLDLLLMCDKLVEQQPNFNLVFCGPPLDEEYTARFFDTLDARPWAHYVDQIPKMAIADSMRKADVIVNNSRSEGVSNALVEAAALGRPILAADIIGNRAVVQHGKNGLLYFDQQQFVQQALQLSRDLKLRKKLSKPNPSAYAPEREIKVLSSLLNQLVAKS